MKRLISVSHQFFVPTVHILIPQYSPPFLLYQFFFDAPTIVSPWYWLIWSQTPLKKFVLNVFFLGHITRSVKSREVLLRSLYVCPSLQYIGCLRLRVPDLLVASMTSTLQLKSEVFQLSGQNCELHSRLHCCEGKLEYNQAGWEEKVWDRMNYYNTSYSYTRSGFQHYTLFSLRLRVITMSVI